MAQSYFNKINTVISDSNTKSALCNTFDQLQERLESGFNGVDNTISNAAWGALTLFVDPILGNDTTGNGSDKKPFKTITAAMNSVPVCPSTEEGAYQWSAEKVILNLSPGEYTEGGTTSVPNDVELNIRRCRVGIKGHGVRIMGNVNWTFSTDDLPYGDAFVMNTLRPYFAAPWSEGVNHVSPTLDLIGEGAGTEGAFVADSIIIMGTVTQYLDLVTTTGWQTRVGNSYIMINHTLIRTGINQDGDLPQPSTPTSLVIEVNDSAIEGGSMGSLIGYMGIKAHNSQLKSVIGPYANVFEIDNCRIQGGFDRTALGASSGNVQFTGGTSYSGIRDCAVNATLFKLGTGTSAVTMYCDEITAKEVLAQSIDTGTGAFTMNVMDCHTGTTAQRPLFSKVSIGYRYFDTTLNQPIWRGNAGWVDATGAGV